MNPKKNRIPSLDIIRGFALVNMIFYHFLYDLVYIFGQQVSWFSIRKGFVWQQMICATFIVISGISFNLSRKPQKNGFVLLFCAAILTTVTFFVIPNEWILFGILHFMAVAVFFTLLLRPLLNRIPARIGLPVALLLYIFLRNMPAGYLSFFSWWQWRLPSGLYQTPYLFFIGLPHQSFSSADYFPLFPWWFLYLAGFYGADYYFKLSAFLKGKCSLTDKKIYKALNLTFGLMGRRSLIIYMLHQPILYGLLFLVYFFS